MLVIAVGMNDAKHMGPSGQGGYPLKQLLDLKKKLAPMRTMTLSIGSDTETTTTTSLSFSGEWSDFEDPRYSNTSADFVSIDEWSD